MKKEIQDLIILRMDARQELELLALDIKSVVDKSGLFSNDEKQSIAADLGGMGAMMAIPAIIGKITPLKAAVPAIKKSFDLLLKINDYNEQIQNHMLLDLYKG